MSISPSDRIAMRSGRFFRLSREAPDRKSTRLNSSHLGISYAVFCLKKKEDGQGQCGGLCGAQAVFSQGRGGRELGQSWPPPLRSRPRGLLPTVPPPAMCFFFK